jgi:hypothetical protein
LTETGNLNILVVVITLEFWRARVVTMTIQEINELRARAAMERDTALQEVQDRYHKQLEAIDIVAAMVRTEVSGSGVANTEQSTLINAIEQVITQYPDKTWDINLLEQALRARTFSFSAKNPKNSLSSSLYKLVAKGTVRIVRSGKGRQPNIYQSQTMPVRAAAQLNGSDVSPTEETSG